MGTKESKSTQDKEKLVGSACGGLSPEQFEEQNLA